MHASTLCAEFQHNHLYMKIHLPINLRKALLTAVFAVSSVAYSGASAQASDLPEDPLDPLEILDNILSLIPDIPEMSKEGYIDNRINSAVYWDYVRSVSFFKFGFKNPNSIFGPSAATAPYIALYKPYKSSDKTFTGEQEALIVTSADYANYKADKGEWDYICAWGPTGPNDNYVPDEEDKDVTNNIEIGWFTGDYGAFGVEESSRSDVEPKGVTLTVNKAVYASGDIIINNGGTILRSKDRSGIDDDTSDAVIWAEHAIRLGKDTKVEGKKMQANDLITTIAGVSTELFSMPASNTNISIDLTEDMKSGGDIDLSGSDITVKAGGMVGAKGKLIVGDESTIEARDIVAKESITTGTNTTLSTEKDISVREGSINLGGGSVLAARGAVTANGDLNMAAGSKTAVTGEGIFLEGDLIMLGGNTVATTNLVADQVITNGNGNMLDLSGSATTCGLTVQGTDRVSIGGDWTVAGDVAVVGADASLDVRGKLAATGDVALQGKSSVGNNLKADGKVSISNLASEMTLVNHLQAGNGLEIVDAKIGTGGDTTVTGDVSLKHTTAGDEDYTSLTTTNLTVTKGNLSVDKADLTATRVTVDGDVAIQNRAAVLANRDMNVGGELMVKEAQVEANVKDAIIEKSLTTQSLSVQNGMVRVYGNAEVTDSAQVTGKSTFRSETKLYELAVSRDLSVREDLSVESGANAFVGGALSVGGTLSVSGTNTKLLVTAGTTADMLYVGSQGTAHLSGNAENNNVSKVKLADGTLRLLTDGWLPPSPSQEYDLELKSLSVAGHSFLEANLIVGAGSELSFAQDSLLTMGCTVTIGSGTALNIDGLEQGVAVVLMNSVDGLTLAGNTVTEDGWYDANGILDSINGVAITENDKYFIGYHSSVVSFKAYGAVPEPATATLSLLALAALAARRRRK